ncbi:MAG: ATP-binding protein [Planctomycetes bacterium]|nr:ATP-binding protein [Planctomycetota bacterium]
MGKRIDGIYAAYLAEDADGRSDIEQTLELLAARRLQHGYEHDRSPFPPPDKAFAQSGDIAVGSVTYGDRDLYPFTLRSARLKEHVLVAGRSGSGKTNLTFMLMLGMMKRGIRILALDWKRGYRDLLSLCPKLRVYTVGRDISPLRFNPLIPPPGCEPGVWIKLIVDVIAGAYLGGEGVISLLVAGLDHLYRQAGVGTTEQTHWPSVVELLQWLRTVKLKGRAAMWQASAERILLALTYGEFGSVVDTQNNAEVLELLGHDVVLEMDGLSGSSDRVMFSEALTMYLYRYRLSQGPRSKLTNMIVLEEAHNLLLAKQAGAKESVLESSIRMIRQYGMGYVFVDQSASLLSKVAFANSYCTMALSQKLQADVRAISGAMNLTDEQKQALNTLPIGTAVVRLADQFPEPFLIRTVRCPIKEGSVTDEMVHQAMAGCSTDSSQNRAAESQPEGIPAVPLSDRNTKQVSTKNPHPPSPIGNVHNRLSESESKRRSKQTQIDPSSHSPPPGSEQHEMTSDEIRFLADVAAQPLSTTVSRYQRLHLSRRRGNAIRQQLTKSGIIKPVPIATRCGQIMLFQLTDFGRTVCRHKDIDPGSDPQQSLEHLFWIRKAAEFFEGRGYEVTREYAVDGNGIVDLLATRAGERIAVEIETGKSDVRENITKLQGSDFDRLVVLATSPSATAVCQRVVSKLRTVKGPEIELLTWLDVG